jgi:predicted Zn-dependent protease
VKQDNQGGAVSGMQAARKAIELDPGHSLGYLWLSNYQWRMREVKGFQENLKKALQTGPNQSSTIYFAGWSALKTNKLESAYEFFKKAKILGPKNWELYFDLGRLDLYFEKYDEAILNVNIYINNTSNKYGIYDVLAQIYLNKGNYKEALEAIEKEPIEYYRWWTKSHILYKMNKKEESEQLLNRLKNEEFSIADHANYTESALNLCIASIYVYRGNKNKAFDYLDNSLDYIYEYSDWFFPLPEFKILYDDPRWNILLDKIENEFNYDLSPN